MYTRIISSYAEITEACCTARTSALFSKYEVLCPLIFEARSPQSARVTGLDLCVLAEQFIPAIFTGATLTRLTTSALQLQHKPGQYSRLLT